MKKVFWNVKMAWRDSRRNRGRLLLFMASIILGIAALVAINTFSTNLQNDMDGDAKELLGADLRLSNNAPAGDSLLSVWDAWPAERSNAVYFVSMVLFPENEATRLVQVRAFEGDYPYYGNLVTEPANAYNTFQQGPFALLEKTLMLQFDAQPGDSIKVGEQYFEIAGQLESAPGRSSLSGTFAPVVYIPKAYLDATGLIRYGSRAEYLHFFRFADDAEVDKKVEESSDLMELTGWDKETVADRKESLGDAFSDLATFLNLVAFIALLLGCLGVASAVHVYIKDKINTVAILRCLGASGRQAFWVYLIQVAVLGLIGGIIGAALGSILQLVMPIVLADFLVTDSVSTNLSWTAIIAGVATGLLITLLFALLPLLRVRDISPLRAIRASFSEETSGRDPFRWLVYLAIAGFVVGFTFWQTGSAQSWIFPIGVGIALLILAGVARGLIWLVRRFFPVRWSYVWRQSIANLYRPNNQTLTLMVTIGLGTALITTLFLVQDLLLQQVAYTGREDQPNMILFDIQSSQKDAVAEMAVEYDLPLIQQVPIVTMRLDNVDGFSKQDVLADTLSEREEWVFNREFRVTYRDTIIDSEKIVEGAWEGQVRPDGSVPISIAEGIADDLGAEVGSIITFNVQGMPLKTVVSSMREVDFARMQTNFLVVFPEGVLEDAPQFHVLISRVDSEERSAAFQREVVKAFPNVSAIDLTQILEAVETVLNKVSFVIRFMALFSILTGIMVLIGSVALSKFQRIKESVLLRTIGAHRRQIRWINGLEYLMLGGLAAFTGILLALVAAFALAKFQFDIPFVPQLGPIFLVWISIVGLTLLIGILNSLEVVRKPPLEVLRKEI